MNRRRKTLLRAAAATLLAAVIGVVVWRIVRRGSDLIEVPLGVEQAVIFTTEGRTLEPLPYAWGVALNVRIADVRAQGTARLHDVRYIVNRDGVYDLKDYLRFEDGTPSDGLPAFRVRGAERLSRNLAARIAETESTRIQVRIHYYRILALLGVVWVGWLLLLIFAGRGRERTGIAPAPEPALADRIRHLLTEFENGSLDSREQARLEMMIFRLWREHYGTPDADPRAGRMSAAVTAFRTDPAVADAYAELENWLHRPTRPDSPARAAQAVRGALDPVAPENPPPVGAAS